MYVDIFYASRELQTMVCRLMRANDQKQKAKEATTTKQQIKFLIE